MRGPYYTNLGADTVAQRPETLGSEGYLKPEPRSEGYPPSSIYEGSEGYPEPPPRQSTTGSTRSNESTRVQTFEQYNNDDDVEYEYID